MRETLPATMPLRVSIEAGWPIWTSLACVSAILSCALSLFGLGDLRERRARRDALADLHRQLLEDAGDAGADVQGVLLGALQRRERLELLDVRLLDGDLRLGGVGDALDALLLDPVARLELLGADAARA